MSARQAHNKCSECGSIDTLLKKIRRAGTIDRQPGSGRPRSVCVNENTENVEDLVFSQEDNLNTHRLNREISCESDTSTPADCYACRLWCPLPCYKWVWLKWYLSTMRWRWTASITAMSCCLSRCFQQSNLSQNVVYSQNNVVRMQLNKKLQYTTNPLDRWGGKWNHLSMTHT